MFGIRVLSIILALVCLAAAGAMLFYKCPQAEPLTESFVRYFIPDTGVKAFIKSRDPVDIRVKNLVKYGLSGAAVVSLGLGLLFLCAAVNPLRMRPFISVVMICSVLMIICAIWQGIRLGVFKSWWIGDASGALIILVLLAALFPKKKPAADSSLASAPPSSGE